MRIAILDVVNQDIGLKILFPEADYYVFHTEIDKSKSFNHYGFYPSFDIENINDLNYDVLFVVMAMFDAVPNTTFYKPIIHQCLRDTFKIIEDNNFQYVGFFDNYDYDYDPNMYFKNDKINAYYKRNYNKNKTYEANVIPFPFIMFGDISLIEKCDREIIQEDEIYLQTTNKIDRVFFSGIIFIHNEHNVYRNRQRFFTSETIPFIYNPGMIPYQDFMSTLRQSKFSLDLLGVGDPNKRTFEILVSGSLMLREKDELTWPFAETFAPETIFESPEDFVLKLQRLRDDDNLYRSCLQIQHNIVKKYFNVEWIKNYILNYIF